MVLRVRLEIVPFGNEDEARTIARLDIFNKGQTDFGHYEYGCIELDKEKNAGALHTRTVLHRRDLGAWRLVEKILHELVNTS